MSGGVPGAFGIKPGANETQPVAAPIAAKPRGVTLAASTIDDLAAAIRTAQGQQAEQAVLSTIPKKVRGTVYAVGGGLSTVAGALMTFAASNPHAFPPAVTAVIGAVGTALAAITGGVAFGNLGKK